MSDILPPEHEHLEAESGDLEVTPPWVYLRMKKLSPFHVSKDRIISGDGESYGGYGVVCRAFLHYNTAPPELSSPCSTCGGAGCSDVAVKKLRSDDGLTDERLEKRLARELLVMSDLEHRNIVKLLGFHLCTRSGEAWIISSWVSGGDAVAYIKSQHPTTAGKLRLISDAGEGLNYLHSRENAICHGDVKGKNLLVDLRDGRGKLCDFGLAFRDDSTLRTYLSTETRPSGTTSWCSPEALHGMVPTPQDDIWSFGCLAYEIMMEKLPFHQDGSSIAKVVLNIIKCHYPTISTRTVPGPVGTMILECWKKRPEERIQVLDAIIVLETAILQCSADGRFENSSAASLDLPDQNIFDGSQSFQPILADGQSVSTCSSRASDRPHFLCSLTRLIGGCICLPCTSFVRQRAPRPLGSEAASDSDIDAGDSTSDAPDPTLAQEGIAVTPLDPVQLQDMEIVLELKGGAYGRSNGLLRATVASTGERVAVKVLHDVKDAFKNLDTLGDAGITKKKSINDSLLAHVRCMSSFCHQFINPTLGYSLIDGLISPITRWCDNGNVKEYLERNPTADRWSLIDQIANGLQVLHSQSPPVIHTALKLENVLVDETGNIRLAEVGSIQLLENLTSGVTTCGKLSDVRWVPRAQENWSVASDVYSFGLLALALLTDLPPYASLTDLEVARHKYAAPPDYMSGLRDSSLWKILCRCFDHNPERRPFLTDLRADLSALSLNVTAEPPRGTNPAPLVQEEGIELSPKGSFERIKSSPTSTFITEGSSVSDEVNPELNGPADPDDFSRRHHEDPSFVVPEPPGPNVHLQHPINSPRDPDTFSRSPPAAGDL